MLFDLLSQHPDLTRTNGYPDGEDHEGWVKHGKCVMAGIGNVHSSKYGNGINGFHYCLQMTGRDVTPKIVDSMRRYYWEDVLEQNAAKRVLNKQPHLSNKLDYVLEIFPDAKIVHIVRDCQPMVASWLAVMGEHPSLVVYLPEEKNPCLWLLPKPDDETALAALAKHPRFFPGGGERLWVEYWRKTNVEIARQMDGRLDQLCTLRYEDLVTKPAAVLNEIAKFGELSPFRFETAHIQTNTKEKHRHLLSNDLRDAIRVETRDARRLFGYGRRLPWSRRAPRLLELGP